MEKSVTQAKLELMEKALLHVGGRIVATNDAEYIYRDAYNGEEWLWRAERKFYSTKTYYVEYAKVLHGETA